MEVALLCIAFVSWFAVPRYVMLRSMLRSADCRPLSYEQKGTKQRKAKQRATMVGFPALPCASLVGFPALPEG